MHIDFTRTGGFAAIRLTTSVESKTLPPDQAENLQKLVDDAGFFDLPAELKPATPRPDRFEYQLSITSGKQTHSITVSDAATPASLKPLLNYLTTLAMVSKKS